MKNVAYQMVALRPETFNVLKALKRQMDEKEGATFSYDYVVKHVLKNSTLVED